MQEVQTNEKSSRWGSCLCASGSSGIWPWFLYWPQHQFPAETVSALAEPTDITAAATTEAATGMAVRETAASTVAAETAGASEDGKININTATVAELTTISGIGEVLAQRIVDYREEHGDFTSLEELTNVTGIGEKRLEAIMDAATVGG